MTPEQMEALGETVSKEIEEITENEAERMLLFMLATDLFKVCMTYAVLLKYVPRVLRTIAASFDILITESRKGRT